MGFRINSLSLMGLQAVTRAKRKQSLQADADSIASASQTKVISSSSSSLGTSLSNELHPPELSALASPDVESRKISTLGLGNRNWGVAEKVPESITRKFPDSEPLTADTDGYDPSTPITQQDMLQLRRAIGQIAEDYVLRNPRSVTEDDLREQIDTELGAEVSDIFGVRVSDVGGGRSVVEFANLDTQNLGPSDLETLKTAAQNAYENFAESDVQRALEGADVDKIFSEIRELFSSDAMVVLDRHQNRLSRFSDFSNWAHAFENDAQDFLSGEKLEDFNQKIEKLQQLDEINLKSFDQNPFADDTRIEWTSDRYGPAFNSEDIDDRASLTNTEGWTTALRLGIIKNKTRYTG